MIILPRELDSCWRELPKLTEKCSRILDVLPILPTSGMYVRSRKLTDNNQFPPYFGNDEFRASVLSGTAAWRGSIGEAAFNEIDAGIYRMDVGVLINDYGDLVAETVWE